MQEYKELYNYELYKMRSRVTMENSRAVQGVWKDSASNGLPMIHAIATHFWSATGRIHKFQTLGSGHVDPGESEHLNEW